MSSAKWWLFCLNILTQEVLQYLTIFFNYIEKWCLMSQNVWMHLQTQKIDREQNLEEIMFVPSTSSAED